MPDMEVELEAAQTAYLANRSYVRTGSTAMALAFAEACRALLLLVPSMSTQGSRHMLDMRKNLDTYERQAAAAEAYAQSDSADLVRHYDVSNFRR